MANLEHLAELQKGVESWNRWRQHHPGARVDLHGADLRKMSLGGADLRDAQLGDANLHHVSLEGANLQSANLSRANLGWAQLENANLSEAMLIGTNLDVAQFAWATLRRANLTAAFCVKANFLRADLTSANLHRANFAEAILDEADLSKASLSGVNLSSAVLDGANLYKAQLTATVFGDNDLRAVKGLEAVVHYGPSAIGIDTIYRSKGMIPESFLRGAGVPDDFITYAKSLTSNAIEFYSCFISYSSKDDAFAAELHTNLQEQHVRCWKDSEDLKIGDRFQEEIERAIRIHDKLLLVLSENSITSSWVEREVQAAFEKEQRQGSTVLFPVRLDDSVMDCSHAWAADIRRTRHIGDFRRWKDHGSFQKSLNRLLRDLKARECGRE